MTSNKDRSCDAAEEERSIFYLLWFVEWMPGVSMVGRKVYLVYDLCSMSPPDRQTKRMRV